MDNIAKLAQLLAVPPKSIDLIPGDGEEWLQDFPENLHAPFLFVEGNLGVPEKALYRAYITAVKNLRNPGSYRKNKLGSDDPSRALELTSVILLANPAHQTVLNLRKSIFFDRLMDSPDQVSLSRRCSAELEFIAALLSVKQCAKVSMLWHYRRTLLARAFRSEYPGLGPRANESEEVCFTDDYFVSSVDLPVSAVRTEFDLTARACEVYPRNYFAWHHRWLCLQSCIDNYTRLASQIQSPLESDPAPSTMTDIEILISSEITNTMIWIERHVSDYSATDYICRIVEKLETAKYRTSRVQPNMHAASIDSPSESGSVRSSELVQHALDLIQSYPSHEALWLYLRQALQVLGSARPPDTLSIVLETRGKARELARSILADAERKCQNLHHDSTGLQLKDVAIREVHTIEKHALRFLLWLSRQRKVRDDYGFLAFSCAHFRDASIEAVSPGTIPEQDKAMLLLRTISAIE